MYQYLLIFTADIKLIIIIIIIIKRIFLSAVQLKKTSRALYRS